MRSEISTAQVGLASPAWLRPSALVLIICIHVAVLVGLPWSTESRIVKAPLEVEVVPTAEPARELAAIDDRQSSELKISEPVSVEAPVIEPTSAIAPNDADTNRRTCRHWTTRGR
jgi:hypothetical protein